MTTSATRQGTARTIAEREAWEAYRESLRDLDGRRLRGGRARLVGAPAGDAARTARRRAGQLSGADPQRTAPSTGTPRTSDLRLGFAAGRTERPGRLETDADEAHGGARAARGRGSARAGRLREQLGGLQERPTPAGPDRHHRLHRRPARLGLAPQSWARARSRSSSPTRPARAQRVTLESAGAGRLGPRHQAGHRAHQPAGHGHAEGRRQARAATRSMSAGDAHPGRAAAGSAPSARARRTTCCNRRPPAAASDTIGPCRYGRSRRCCASASCSAPGRSRRRHAHAEPAGALPRRAAQGRRTRPAASSACCAPTPASSRPRPSSPTYGRRQVRRGGDGRERRRGGRGRRLRPHGRGLRQRRAARRLPQPVALPRPRAR